MEKKIYDWEHFENIADLVEWLNLNQPNIVSVNCDPNGSWRVIYIR